MATRVGSEEHCSGRTYRLAKGLGITISHCDCLCGILHLASLISNL